MRIDFLSSGKRCWAPGDHRKVSMANLPLILLSTMMTPSVNPSSTS